ncbi:FAD-dependent monooxygenase, partial [Nonomuraea sp. K274]
MKAVVIGGGLGGLTCAAALQRAGCEVTLFERAQRFEQVGAGITIGPNALRALDTLGIGERVRALSAMQGDVAMRRSNGTVLIRTSGAAATARYGDPTVVLPRPVLIDLLATLLPASCLVLGTEVRSCGADAGMVRTDDGMHEADLVVAADGIWSRTRAALFPGHPDPVFTGMTAWRFITDRPPGSRVAGQFLGRGLEVGVMPMAHDKIYCYAGAPAAPGHTAPDEKAELLRLFGGWVAPVPELIRAAAPESVLRNDVYSLDTPLPALHKGRTALIGDAAHPMMPSLGQGGNQAIEDAIVLAHHVTHGEGLEGYTRARRERTAEIVRKSRALGRMALLSNPAAVALRDAGLWLAGRRGGDSLLKHGDAVSSWRPPG